MLKENTIKIFEKSFIDNWELPALSDYNEKTTMTYGDFARDIARVHLFYEQSGIKPGDKVALIGKNTPMWVTVYMATITYGAVIVPILQEFNPTDAQHIVNHSEAVLLFASKAIWESLDFDQLHRIRAVISLDSRQLLAEKPGETVSKVIYDLSRQFEERYKSGFYRNDIHYADVPGDQLMELNYTSGTTGFSKGVMLTGNNLCGNIVYGINSGLHYKGSRCLSFLPLAHAYGCAFDMLTPLAVGSHITLLGRIPSPKVLVKALGEIKPNLVICVPLILEKIYSKMIVPMISKGMLRWALAVPYLDRRIYSQIRKKLIEAFGGEFEEIIVGGAPFNAEVEEFLYKIKFPFTVGYGMTECGPLVSHTPWREFVLHSAGRVLPGLMECKILSDDPENVPGEICVRGENVMKGYFHNSEATDKVLHDDGWLHTGDMGTLSADGTVFIKGRLKTMLLGPSGQNIYPEEIEAKLNNMLYVSESLVVEREGKLVALVYPDYEAMDQLGVTRDQLPELMENIRAELNKLVAPYERIAKIQLIATEFEKTPKRSIKRYLYSN
ncbi:MAG: AMP-binding protein [Muribaculaceae bacterium]|nr:AMP-binding protein [Muribaculaceae bacterium]MBR1474350.1 AMP-binding protein [Muribaculaceae bacterium]MBR1726337.1 AMP-binding protein [Muribaculaceae bacterium]